MNKRCEVLKGVISNRSPNTKVLTYRVKVLKDINNIKNTLTCKYSEVNTCDSRSKNLFTK